MYAIHSLPKKAVTQLRKFKKMTKNDIDYLAKPFPVFILGKDHNGFIRVADEARGITFITVRENLTRVLS